MLYSHQLKKINITSPSLHAGGWMVEKTGIRNVVAILDSRGHVFSCFVNPQPGPDLAARIQDGDLIANSSFFDHPTACVQAIRPHAIVFCKNWMAGSCLACVADVSKQTLEGNETASECEKSRSREGVRRA